MCVIINFNDLLGPLASNLRPTIALTNGDWRNIHLTFESQLGLVCTIEPMLTH